MTHNKLTMSSPRGIDQRRMQELVFEEMADGDEVLRMLFNRGIVFFEPSSTFVRWIGEYAAGRMIVEIGSGTAHVLHLLRSFGYTKVMGIEPAWDPVEFTRSGQDMTNPLHVIPWTVEKARKMITDLTSSERVKAMLLICRPCHGTYVEEAIDAAASGTTIMYITKPENIEKYQDCGKYQHLLEEVPHEGTSTDGEKVYVLTKP